MTVNGSDLTTQYGATDHRSAVIMKEPPMFEINASDLPHFMACKGSRFMPASRIDTQKNNEIRDEGEAAHYMAAAMFRNEFKAEEMIDRKAPNGVYMTDEMLDHISDYMDVILNRDVPTFQMMEYETSFAGNDWKVKCRVDHVMLGFHRALYIDDFKYGYRIVEPSDNWTLIAYAISVCIENSIAPDEIILTIHQPRAFHPDGPTRSIRLSYPELLEKYNELNAALASPEQLLRTNSFCATCHAFPTCPAARKAEMNAIDMTELVFSDTVTNDMLSYYLDTLGRSEKLISARLEAFEELARHRLKNGQVIENYSVEPQLGNTRWLPHVNNNALMAITGKNIAVEKLPTPAAAKRAGVPEEIVKAFTERPTIGLKLKRSNANDRATRLFGAKTDGE